ncbi:MAG TPA: cytochrome c biogenesis protein CcdA [Chitinophagaceae bacterium]|nr:cytochrome c biogenesis protein CcdA [Chitinophagaceae bacterium]
MKKIIFLLAIVISGTQAFAQTPVALTWNLQSKRITPNTYEVSATTAIPKGWYMYANDSADGITMAFIFDYAHVKPQGNITVNKTPETENDAAFNKKLQVFTGDVTLKQTIIIDSIVPSSLKITVNASVGKPAEAGKQPDFYPLEMPMVVAMEGGVDISANAQRIKIASIDVNHPISNYGAVSKVKGSLLAVFFIGFLGGFIALLTPCVFPMIPVTVSFFTSRASNRKQGISNGILYGFFIFLIYTLISVPFHLLNLNPEVLNNISTNAVLNVVFFTIFLVFSISFFGYFEITLPSNLATKTDTKSSFGTVGGIFFMALTLTIVSFSCTGPILGSLLVGSLSGGAWLLTAGLAGFGLALALPFAVFAIFPNLLKALPRSGGWLDTVKKVLAFVELALAFKFLSMADLVMHWGILKREVFFGLWIAISISLFLYLFGILRLPHDYKGMKISTGRKIAGVIVVLFTLYLLPGVTNTKYANLKLLSGFPPPLHYSIYGKDNVNGKGLAANVVNDYDKALALAREQHKPLMIDFTGWACTNCRRMEENVWTDPAVYKYIKDNYILVSLYVDDREKLPILKQLPDYKTTDGHTKEIITNGDKWATFETENIGQSAQPYYILLTNDERLINNPVAYTPDAKQYLKWLQNGKETFDSTRAATVKIK